MCHIVLTFKFFTSYNKGSYAKGGNMKRKLENEVWGKTLISLYRHLGTMANSIDNLIKRIGINSAFNHSVYNSTLTDSNKIIELTERKIKIINLKVIIEKALNKLKTNDFRILSLCYIDAVNYKKIQEILNVSERTFFRRKELAIARFSSNLSELGYDAEKLNDYLQNENWVKNAYFQVINSTAKVFCGKEKSNEQFKLMKLVLNDFNTNFSKSYSYFN